MIWDFQERATLTFIPSPQVGGLPAPQPGDMLLMPSLVYGQIFVMHNGEHRVVGKGQWPHPVTVQGELELQGREPALPPGDGGGGGRSGGQRYHGGERGEMVR